MGQDHNQNPQSAKEILREKAFSIRLQQACEHNPRCPTEQYRGKQKWIYDSLLEQHGIKVSPEAVRKWLLGSYKPKVKVMRALAAILEVDMAWLMAGPPYEMTPMKRARDMRPSSVTKNPTDD